MIERKTVLEQSELHRSGVLQLKFAAILVDDGIEIDCKWLRTSIELDGDAQLHMESVNAAISVMDPPWPLISQEDITFIKASHALQVSRFKAPVQGDTK